MYYRNTVEPPIKDPLAASLEEKTAQNDHFP